MVRPRGRGGERQTFSVKACSMPRSASRIGFRIAFRGRDGHAAKTVLQEFTVRNAGPVFSAAPAWRRFGGHQAHPPRCFRIDWPTEVVWPSTTGQRGDRAGHDADALAENRLSGRGAAAGSEGGRPDEPRFQLFEPFASAKPAAPPGTCGFCLILIERDEDRRPASRDIGSTDSAPLSEPSAAPGTTGVDTDPDRAPMLTSRPSGWK